MDTRGPGIHFRLVGAEVMPFERRTFSQSFNSLFNMPGLSGEPPVFLSEGGVGEVPNPPARPYFDWRAAKTARKSFFGAGVDSDSAAEIVSDILLLSSEDCEERGEDMDRS